MTREAQVKEGPLEKDSLVSIEARVNGYLTQWNLAELQVDHMTESFDRQTNQRVVRAFLNRRSMEKTMEIDLRDAFRRNLSYPYELLMMEGKFSTLSSTGALSITYADTMVIEYRPLAVSDESVGRSCKYVTMGVLGLVVLWYFLSFLLSKDQ